MSGLPNVLIVDDSNANLFFWESVLKPFNVNILKFSSDIEALENSIKTELALALIDVRMPEIRALEFVSKLNEFRKENKVPVIILTASTPDELQTNIGFETGFVDYIFKPLIPHLLSSKISILLQFYKQKQIITNNAILLGDTDPKLSEEKLQESESRYKLLIESASEGILVAQDGMIRYANPKLIELSGYSLEELTSNPFLDLIHPDDRELAIQSYQNLLAGLNSNINCKYRCFHKNKNVILLNVSGVAIEWAGKPATMNFLSDITIDQYLKGFEDELLNLSVNLTSAASTDIPQAIELTLSRIAELFDAERANIFIIEQEAGIFYSKYEIIRKEVQPLDLNLNKFSCNLFPMAIKMLLENEIILIPEVSILPIEWKAEREAMQNTGMESLVAIPLQIKNQIYGFAILGGIANNMRFIGSGNNLFRVWGNLITGLIVRQQVGTLLEQTQQNYNYFLNTIDDFLFVLDKNATIIYSNSTASKRLGYTMQEFTGNPVTMIHPPELREEANQVISEMQVGNTDMCRFPLMTKNGSMISAEIKLTSGYWNGNPAYFLVIKDITKLKLSEEKFSKVFYLNPSACGLSELETGKYVEVNQAFSAMFGYSQEEALGKTAVELGIMSAETMSVLKKKIDGQDMVLNLETKLKARNGDVKDVLMSSENIKLQDSTHRFTVVHDVTERNKFNEALKKNESLLAEAQQIAHIGSWELNEETKELIWSKEVFRIFGYEPNAFIPSNEIFIQLVHPEDVDMVEKAIKEARNSKASYSIDHRIILPDGNVKIVHENAKIYYNTAGVALKWIGTVQDITERKMNEEKLQNAIEQQQNLISHIEKVRENERVAISRELHDDLGQALTAVKIDLAIIRNTFTDIELANKINKVSALVSDTIKTVQRLTSQLRPEIISDLGLKAAIEWYTKEFAQRTSIEIRLEMDSLINLPDEFSLHIFRILQESLTNSARHAKATVIEIKLIQSDQAIHFTISDNGSGIATKKIKSSKSFGIISMQERTSFLGGTFEIRKKAEGGTLIKLVIPKR